jgi:tetratricopeptide (TPR) repeat protein
MIERLLAADAALERGETDVAERLYRQVVDADPRNAIALVGLARVAQGRGDPDSARELATRALAIDPDEAAARRLVDSLADAPPSEMPTPEVAPPAPGRHRGFWGFVRRLLRRM